MQTVIRVKGMVCAHCVHAVEQVLLDIGMDEVHGDLESGAVMVTHVHPIDGALFQTAIEEAGYELE